MPSIEQELGKQLNKIDSNKKDWLEREEIDKFLLNEKKVQKLWNTMQENFEAQSEKLQEYKENVWKICERILENENINLSQWKILLFYLKHFHNENAGVWRDIIKSVIEWKGWNRYQEVVSNMSSKKFSKHENEESEEDKQKLNERFNNLPWTKEIKEEWECAQNLKKCDWILVSQDRLTQEDIQWLQWYKTTSGLDSELVGRIETRLDLEKCYQLLGAEELTSEEIQWLNEYKNNWNLNPEFLNKIDEKIKIENLKRCNNILQSKNSLSIEDIQRLKEYKENWAKESWQELIDKIDERLKLEQRDQDIAREIDSEISGNPLSNLESICQWLEKVKPNWSLIIQNIKPWDIRKLETQEDINKLVEKITKLITEENISQYLPLPQWTSEEDKYYITNNFQNILIKHLCLHPGYKISWWLNPDAYATGMNLKNMVVENNLLESAFKKLEELNKGKKSTFDKLKPAQKNQQLELVFRENNHILFDLRLKNVLNSCDKKNIWDMIAYVINYSSQKYPAKLKEFVKSNWFINSVYQEYNKAKRQAEDEQKRVEEEKRRRKEVEWYLTWSKVDLPQNIQPMFSRLSHGNAKLTRSITILPREQIWKMKNVYDKMVKEKSTSESYNYFCSIYEASKKFYGSEWIQNSGLPNCLDAKDYIDYLSALENMESDINKVKREHASFRRGWWGTIWYTWAVDMWAAMYYSGKEMACNVQAARKFVELWKKWIKRGWWSRRPDNFMWIKLDRSHSNNNPNDNSDIDDIIRDSTLEWIVDKIKTFWRNLSGWCFQQAFWDIIWLWIWLASSVVVTGFTWSPALGGAAYYLWSEFGNGVAQVGRDLVVDGLGGKVLWLWGESWNNKYDGVRDSFRLWIGQGERDIYGNVVDGKSRWEWAIDTVFGTAASAATYSVAAKLGISQIDDSFKFWIIREFFGQPLGNVWSAATKSIFWTENYEDVSISTAMTDQLKQEYWVQWITKKCVNAFLVTAMVKWFKATYKWSKGYSDIICRIDNQLDKVSSLLKSKWIENIWYLRDEQISSLMGDGFSGMIDDLVAESQRWWNSIIVPMAPLVSNGLISSQLSPMMILRRRFDWVSKRIKSTTSPQEKDRYQQLLARYQNLGNYIRETMPDLVGRSDNLNWGEWVAESPSQNHPEMTDQEIEQQIDNDLILLDSWTVSPSDWNEGNPTIS